MDNQGIALIDRQGRISWVYKKDYLSMSTEARSNFAKTAFFWIPENGNPKQFQGLAEKALNYNPWQGVDKTDD